MRVSSFIDRFYPKVSPEDLLTHARALMRDLALRLLPVVDERGSLKGIVTRKHVLLLSSTKSNAVVRDVMDTPQLVFKPEEDALRAFKAMIELDEWFVPVAKDPSYKYVGMLSLDSYLREMLRRESPCHEKRVEEFMRRDVTYVTPEDFISRLWRKMVSLKYSGFPVVRGKARTVVGIITEHDLLRKGYTRIELESESGPRHGARVKEAMTSPAIVVKPYNRLREAVELMVRNDFGRLPVTDDRGSLIGIIDRADACSVYLKRY